MSHFFITDVHYNKIINQMNDIFKNVNDDIKNEIYKAKNIKCRDSKLKFDDTLLYSFYYCKPKETKLKIVSDLNFKNDNKNKYNNDIGGGVSFYFFLLNKYYHFFKSFLFPFFNIIKSFLLKKVKYITLIII